MLSTLRPASDVADWRAVATPLPPPAATAGALLAAAYWQAITAALRGAVRPVGPPLGPLALRLGGRGPALLTFGAAEATADGVRFPITGGLAAARPGGALALAVEERRVGVLVTGYAPRLVDAPVPLLLLGAPWTVGQRLAHVLVTREALPRLVAAAEAVP